MTDERKAAIKERIVEWALSQGTSFVIALMLLGAIGWGGRYALTEAIPQHIAAIQKLFIELETRHRAEREDRDEKWRDLVRELSSRRTEN